MSSSAIETKIQDAAERNKQLLHELSETDHATPQLAEHRRLIAELDEQRKQSDKRLEELEKKRKRTLSEHEKYRDSHVRRFMFKASGQRDKFSQRAEDGEREYFDTLQEAHQETELNKNIKEQLEGAHGATGELEKQAERHQRAQSDLDALYNSIFGGPTPLFPDEDAKEQRSGAAAAAYADTKGKQEAEAAAVEMLKQANGIMKSAMGQIESALSASRFDMFGGGSMADMMERSRLSKADQLIMRARVLATRAQSASPFVRDLPEVNINHGNLMSDVFFDNVFTDMAFHEEIKRSQREAHRFLVALVEQGNQAVQRRSELEDVLKVQEREMVEARAELQKAREGAFEQVLRGGAPAQSGEQGAAKGVQDVQPPPGPPPSYNASGTGEGTQKEGNGGAEKGKKEWWDE
ncbi:hypothetical protein K4F52_002284 [Lecanicillium sp. MT-2017a]|nr:hypothetical protein K4F52_002284 [Lecanicillium sp. MT-2017a]